MESPQSRCEQIIHQHRVAAGTFVALLLTLSVSEAVAERARNVMEEPSAADFINQGLVDANPSLLAVSHYRDGGPCLVVQDPQGAIGDALLKCPNGDGPVFVDPEASGGMYYLIDEIINKEKDDDIFYLRSRGLSESEASAMIVNGFINPIVKELPLEYAVEMNRMVELEMENSVG